MDRFRVRAKRISGDEDWVIGYYAPFPYPTSQHDDEKAVPSITELHTGIWYLIDPATLGQCSGLRDKNGIMIFEDDIVIALFGSRSGMVRELAVIEFSLDESAFIARRVRVSHRTHVSMKNAKKFEIIGNIHDNPELLGDDNG